MKKFFILPLFTIFITKLYGISILVLNVDNNNTNSVITFDLSTVSGFPPTTFPKCYYPSQGTQSNPHGVSFRVNVFNIFGRTISSAYVDVRLGSNPSSTIAANQLYWTVSPATLPPDGTTPQPPWTPFSLSWENLDVLPVAGQNISRQYNMDICFELENDDEPTTPQGVNTYLYIRFYGL